MSFRPQYGFKLINKYLKYTKLNVNSLYFIVYNFVQIIYPISYKYYFMIYSSLITTRLCILIKQFKNIIQQIYKHKSNIKKDISQRNFKIGAPNCHSLQARYRLVLIWACSCGRIFITLVLIIHTLDHWMH